MAKEIVAIYATGKTLYAFVFSATGQVWNTSGTPAFEAITSTDWTSYAITLTEATVGTGIYTGNFPSAIVAGTYAIAGYLRAGGSPAVGDLLIGTESNFGWDGAKRVTQSDLREILGTASAGAAGYVGPDWGHVNAPTTTVGLTGTTIASSQVVASVTGNVGGSVVGSVASVTGNVAGNVTGSVGSIVGVTFPANFGVLAIVASTGQVGIDWGNIHAPTTTVNLSDTTISTSQAIASVSGAVGSVTGNIGGNVVGSVGSIAGVTFPANFSVLAIAATTGQVGIDWSNIKSPTTTQNLSGTTISTTQTITSVSGSVGSVTGSVGGNVNGNVAGSVGSVVGNLGGNVVGNVNGSVASVTGNVGGNLIGNVNGNVVGSVGSVVGEVTANVTQWAGTNVAATNTAGVPVVDTRQVLRVATAQAGGATSITLDSGASTTDNYYRHAQIYILSGTGMQQAARTITASVGVSKVATVTPAWAINPDSSSLFMIIGGSSDVGAWNGGGVSATTAGIPDINVKNYNNQTAVTDANSLPSVDVEDIRGTLSAATAGYVGPDWSTVHAPTSSVNLTNTNIANVIGFVGSVTGNIGGNIVGNVDGNVNGTVSGVTGGVGLVFGNVGGSVNGSVGSVLGNVGGNLVGNVDGNVNGNVVGSVASVTDSVTVGTNEDKTGYTLASLIAIPNNWITAAGIAAGALNGKGDWNTVTPPTVAAIATAILTDTTSSDFAVVGSPGHVLVTQLGGTFTSTSSSIFTATALENAPAITPPTAAVIATTVWQDLLASDDFGVTGSIGALLKSNVVTTVTNPVTVGTVTDKTGYVLAANGVDAIILEAANGTFPAINLRQGMCLVMDAAPAGLISGVTTAQVTVSNQSGNTVRIIANVDANGNRLGFATFNPPA